MARRGPPPRAAPHADVGVDAAPARVSARSIEGGEQREKSSYMLFFRSPEAEPFFLDNDAAGLRGLYTASGLTEDADAEYVRVLTQPGAMTAALNWYRAADLGLVEGLGPITTPTLYVWSTTTLRWGGRRPRRRRGTSKVRTGSRCSRAWATGSRKRRPTR